MDHCFIFVPLRLTMVLPVYLNFHVLIVITVLESSIFPLAVKCNNSWYILSIISHAICDRLDAVMINLFARFECSRLWVRNWY